MKLENLNLVELDAQELKETEGGWIGFVAGLVIGYLLSEDVDNIKDAWNTGVKTNNTHHGK
jgi:lactobin A/cerein 7B family class IIb bacteriocin